MSVMRDGHEIITFSLLPPVMSPMERRAVLSPISAREVLERLQGTGFDVPVLPEEDPRWQRLRLEPGQVLRESGKAVARTGLRMMPTSPPPPLKFRTAGFPQYGFKASLSAGACPSDDRVKLTPSVLRTALGLPPPSRTSRLRNGGLSKMCQIVSPAIRPSGRSQEQRVGHVQPPRDRGDGAGPRTASAASTSRFTPTRWTPP